MTSMISVVILGLIITKVTSFQIGEVFMRSTLSSPLLKVRDTLISLSRVIITIRRLSDIPMGGIPSIWSLRM